MVAVFLSTWNLYRLNYKGKILIKLVYQAKRMRTLRFIKTLLKVKQFEYQRYRVSVCRAQAAAALGSHPLARSDNDYIFRFSYQNTFLSYIRNKMLNFLQHNNDCTWNACLNQHYTNNMPPHSRIHTIRLYKAVSSRLQPR